MATDATTSEVIASALSLTEQQRLAVMDAIHVSLADGSVDHGPMSDSSQAQLAWKEEIARRIADLKSGNTVALDAEEAERMIRGDSPSV